MFLLKIAVTSSRQVRQIQTRKAITSIVISVPYGGVGNPKRSDRVLVNLSPDGRVHEAPIVS